MLMLCEVRLDDHVSVIDYLVKGIDIVIRADEVNMLRGVMIGKNGMIYRMVQC